MSENMPSRIFYSYAHEDESWRQELGTLLKPLVQKGKIVEWHDRKITPGCDWNAEISEQLRKADLIFFLISKDFLASDYCFGVEVDTAMERLKKGGVRVVPILLKPCLWRDSRFSALQFLPRDAKPVITWPQPEIALAEVAEEISKIVKDLPAPLLARAAEEEGASTPISSLVREQVRAYAHLYERTRQRMRASDDRRRRMEDVFLQMRALAMASYPMLDELAASPSPGERLAAVAILQVFASQEHLPFLVGLVRSEKPFVSYHAIIALRFAVTALHPTAHAALLVAIQEAKASLQEVHVKEDTDRYKAVVAAEYELQARIEFLAGRDE
jgi:hypothetical protein